ncbi:MBL fold metallo-hydrolase [Paenibacillus sp. y28]|uniref:MBL fold metallo-hydrolase n=1 Tax=Paenibacillus sp. y28 TaxID=3129110 RepID=UPI00301B0DE6
MKFSILASGSTGNSMVVEAAGRKVLVDAGLSAKKIDQLLQDRGISGKELDAIMITHEHADHIKGVGALARKYDLPVMANEKTWTQLDKQLGQIAEDRRVVMQTGEMRDFGELKVESYAISHDAAEPVGYCFYHGEEKLGLATDLGYVSSKVKETIEDSDVLVLESNHDVQMLRMGHYPWNIKRRILSDVGHLSNEAAGEALSEMASGKTKRVYLAHLSRDHNLMDLARMTVQQVLEERNVTVGGQPVELLDTFFDRATKWDTLSRD